MGEPQPAAEPAPELEVLKGLGIARDYTKSGVVVGVEQKTFRKCMLKCGIKPHQANVVFNTLQKLFNATEDNPRRSFEGVDVVRKLIEKQELELPAGWIRKFSKKSDGIYFYNKTTGEKTWDHPSQK